MIQFERSWKENKQAKVYFSFLSQKQDHSLPQRLSQVAGPLLQFKWERNMKYLLCAEEEVVLAPKDWIYLLEEDKIYIQVATI